MFTCEMFIKLIVLAYQLMIFLNRQASNNENQIELS